MAEMFRKENTLYKILTLAVLAAAAFFAYRIVYAGIMALPYPKELLEPSNVALTRMFMQQKSPYTLSALDESVPAINFDYPFLNSLIAAAIASLTGCTAQTAHFSISLICILATGVLGVIMTAPYAKTTVTPALSGLLFMFCHWRYGYISAAPDDLGLLLMLLTVYAAVSRKIKNKPVWCAVGVTLCFYTKQYLAFAAVGIFIYMFLYSKKDAIRFLLWSLFINVAVAAAVTLFWPLFWTYSIYFMYMGALTSKGNGLLNFLEQLKYLLVAFAALFVILIIALAKAVRAFVKKSGRLKNITFKENDAFTLCIVMIFAMLIPLVILGRNDGAFITYFLQLWMPFISVAALAAIERMKDGMKEKLYGAALVVVAVFCAYFGFAKLPLHILTEEEKADWEKAYGYIETYGASKDVYYSRGLAYDSFLRGGGQCICGHDAEVVGSHTRQVIEAEPSLAALFPYVDDLAYKNLAYHDMIRKKAEDNAYSLITFEEPGVYDVLTDEVCEDSGYECIDRIDLQIGNMRYETAFYAYKP